MIEIRQLHDVMDFLKTSEGHLLKNESRNSMPLGILDGIRTGLRLSEETPIFLTVLQSTELIGVALRTPPRALVVTEMSETALVALRDWCLKH